MDHVMPSLCVPSTNHTSRFLSFCEPEKMLCPRTHSLHLSIHYGKLLCRADVVRLSLTILSNPRSSALLARDTRSPRAEAASNLKVLTCHVISHYDATGFQGWCFVERMPHPSLFSLLCEGERERGELEKRRHNRTKRHGLSTPFSCSTIASFVTIKGLSFTDDLVGRHHKRIYWPRFAKVRRGWRRQPAGKGKGE